MVVGGMAPAPGVVLVVGLGLGGCRDQRTMWAPQVGSVRSWYSWPSGP